MLPIELNHDEFIEEVINELKKEIIFQKYPNGFYMVYGSYVIREENENSDMDVIYIHKINEPPFRKQLYYNSIPVTIYFLSRFDFEADSTGKYGGYFVGKALNPHIIISSNNFDHMFIYKCCGRFIGEIANYTSLKKQNHEYELNQIVKDVFSGYLKICPPYISYLVRYNVAKNKDIIANWIIENVKRSLIISNSIKQIDVNKYVYNNILSQNEYEQNMIDYVASFWSFGALSHNDMNFYKHYKNKNYQYIINNNYQIIADEIYKKIYNR